jgi:hypothetical protein
MSEMKTTVDLNELATLFRVNTRAARRMTRLDGFPTEVAGLWDIAQLYRWAAAQADPRIASVAPIGYQHPSAKPAEYLGVWNPRGAWPIDRYWYLLWDTWLGVVCLGWQTGIGDATRLEEIVRGAPQDAYAVIAVGPYSNSHMGEELPSLDTHYPLSSAMRVGADDSLAETQSSSSRWQDLSRFLGQPVPYWPTACRPQLDGALPLP